AKPHRFRARRVDLSAEALSLVLGMALALTGCVGADRSVSVAVAGGDPALGWTSCGRDFECATLQVPVDHDRPAGRRIGIDVVRRPARVPGRRLGSLLVNPGGPGGSAVEFVRRVASRLDDEVQDRFDVVGFDPRGVGRSAPLDCAGEREMYLVDPTIEDGRDRDELLRTSGAFVDDCEEKYAGLLPHSAPAPSFATWSALRAARRGPALLSRSLHGTSIGQVYADQYPDRVRAMVLDGVVDLSKSGLEAARAQAEGSRMPCAPSRPTVADARAPSARTR
ncbi:MAG: hypothetical protein WKF43_16815, partial [Acidimicrobiales bacterium]